MQKTEVAKCLVNAQGITDTWRCGGRGQMLCGGRVNDVMWDMYREPLVESDLRSRPVRWELELPGQR